MKNCSFCELIKQHHHQAKIIEFENSVAYLHEDQSFVGRTVLLLKRHYDHLHELPESVFWCFNQEMKMLSEGIRAILQPDRLNYAILGNQVAHLHWHIIPRYRSDASWGFPPWPSPQESRLMHQQYLSLAEKIFQATENYRQGTLDLTANLKTAEVTAEHNTSIKMT